MSAVKDLVGPAVDRLAGDLEKLSRQIHDNPELGYQEIKAAAWLTEFLDKQGFKVERGVAGVETAFRGTIETGEGPTIAILCEYDALPGFGHACGHNVIATAGVGAGAALAALRDKLPKGRIQVIGTPAEEGGGGKVRLIKGGVFKTVDAAMMIHGFDRWIMHQDLLGIVRTGFEFSGTAAHATGCTLKVIAQPDNVYEPMKRNTTLLDLFRANARTFGVVESPESRERMGSSDVGNVSQVIPAIQPMVQIAPEGTPIHSRAFEQAAVRPLARDGMLTSAKIMAMTTCDLLANPALVRDARREFEATT